MRNILFLLVLLESHKSGLIKPTVSPVGRERRNCSYVHSLATNHHHAGKEPCDRMRDEDMHRRKSINNETLAEQGKRMRDWEMAQKGAAIFYGPQSLAD